MKNIKETLIDLGFKQEEIGFVPYLIFYKYKYCKITDNNVEFEITVVLYSNGSYEIQKQTNEQPNDFINGKDKNYFKGKISELNSAKVIDSLFENTGLKDLIKWSKSSNRSYNVGY